jgi:CubicO group peptidase (beta-lactamase class C family)
MDAAGRLHEGLADLRFRGAVRLELGDEVLLDEALGEDGTGVALTTDTAFQIASVSKSFDAACVMLLVDRGLLSLDDTLPSRVTGTPPEWDAITLRHLLTHTSGLAHWDGVTGLDAFNACRREELIALFAATPMKFKPGERFSYSSLGFVLLADMVESVAGMPYPSFLADHVLEPLGLSRTRAAAPPPGVAAAHGSEAGKPVEPFELATVCVGTGDVWSTTGDLVRWPSALAGADVLRAETRTEIFSGPAPIGPGEDGVTEVPGLTDLAYGYGWYTARFGGERLVFHTGDNPGFASLVAWAPDRDLHLAVLEADQADFSPLVLSALAELLAQPRT